MKDWRNYNFRYTEMSEKEKEEILREMNLVFSRMEFHPPLPRPCSPVDKCLKSLVEIEKKLNALY